MLQFIAHGLVTLPWWGYLIILAVTTHLSVVTVTLYYHRDQAHRALDLHPILRQFFRFWGWLSTGMVVREWVAVHRKHHAFVDREGDPHSPRLLGLNEILWNGAAAYGRATRDQDMIKKYSHGTPNDWLDQKLYSRYSFLGVSLLLVVEATLFGAAGVAMWALQMMNIPLLAAGVINGLGHAVGYRNFDTADASTNVSAIGIIAGGEELHNNHHAFPSSAKFSVRPYEFDVGWLYIKVLSSLRMAKVRRVYPRPQVATPRHIDLESVRAVFTNRMYVLREYHRGVLLPTLQHELDRYRASGYSFRALRRLFLRDATMLEEADRERRAQLLERSQKMATVWKFRERLREIWDERAASNDRLIEHLRRWCEEAEESGITALAEFSAYLASYRLVT